MTNPVFFGRGFSFPYLLGRFEVEANWVHAYLHRVEGDNANAAYWYQCAGKPVCVSRLGDEWEEIVVTLVSG
jgi:hypothetical protein